MAWFRRLYKRVVTDSSIFNKIFYGVLIIVCLVIFVSSFFSYKYTRNMYVDEAVKNAARLVDNINTEFEDNLDQVDQIIQSIYAETDYADSSNSIKEILSTKSYTGIEDEFHSLKVIRNFFQRLMFLRKDFNSFYIYSSKEKVFSYAIGGKNKLDYSPTNEAWFKQTMEADGRTIILPPHYPFQLQYNKEVISFSRLLKNIDDFNAEPYGVILLDLSMDSLKGIIDKARLSEKTGVLFLDPQGNEIYQNKVEQGSIVLNKQISHQIMTESNGNYQDTIDGKSYLISFNTSSVTGWKLLTLTPYTEIVKGGDRLLLFYMELGIAAVMITILLAYMFSKVMFKPIHKLHKGMNKVKAGSFEFQLEHYANDELGQLIQSFNAMVSTIRTLITEKYEEKLARSEAEFKYLQAQINPHFMYNTLQIISSMAIVKKVPEIHQVSKSLAKIMRYSLNTDNNHKSVQEELEIVSSYLDIQKLRYKEYLNYQIDVEQIGHVPILKLVIQPIVENAIVHGIELKGANGWIQLSSRIEGEHVCIDVFDNGVGIPRDRLEKLMQHMNHTETMEWSASLTDNNHIGLKNIHQRLKLMYGAEYGLQIESEEGNWTRVTIHIPLPRPEGRLT
ncbi:hypothetical protein A8709_21315 [Paenibacillus pectinilyticus]|uniref:histidine kinase n=1 Tax=Paenibacillus pectinilyticus TaxID=512399 RepID=A0A1C0ZXN4_9BACL|nr:sensor histidine kinase [Paenibacillus pectinilyticus]OCT12874.1 hypothetical protein A8709_21315 [Paenibacillus pectinilyticus]